MIQIRRSEERGHVQHGWLEARHSFSFGEYHDPEHMGFRSLRVINEDRVQPDNGFGTHPHRNMEIITYVLAGSLAHRDSMGNESVLGPGDIQRMSAGSGVRHSEMNPSPDEPVHLLQIWIEPEVTGLEPSYEEMHMGVEDKRGRLAPVVAPDGSNGALRIHQDAHLYATVLESGEEVAHTLAAGRHAWIQVVEGTLQVNGQELRGGDAAAVSDEDKIVLTARSRVEALLFDLA